jgi:hypothetical protein
MPATMVSIGATDKLSVTDFGDLGIRVDLLLSADELIKYLQLLLLDELDRIFAFVHAIDVLFEVVQAWPDLRLGPASFGSTLVGFLK